MGNNARKRRRLVLLWLRDSRCYWCGIETALYIAAASGTGTQRHAPDAPEKATIDHLHSKLSGKRYEVHDWTELTVLACYECNHRRGKEEQQAVGIEELHRRSGSYPSENNKRCRKQRLPQHHSKPPTA